jgi:GrpB-like predicted nucleotidyltransferase (UPF0157 family)
VPERVIIVEYNPQWPLLYEEERARILGKAGDALVAIEHMGSTAVPGLGAKPIIDIMAAVRDLADAQRCIGPLQSIGYEYVPEYEGELPERRYFRKGPPESRTHHLHVVEPTSDFWERHLLFRDFLRQHPEKADEYYRLKRELADHYGQNRVGYTEAKTPFIRSVEEMARAEKGQSVR